jgi:DNA-binding response OmpR family regulator
MRVLLVDDTELDRQVFAEFLTAEGYEVDTAADGLEALKRVWEQRPDIVVLDVMMPGMDGWTTCARLREVTDVPILMLTALNDEDEIVRGLELGADDFVSKPASPRQVLARISAVLRRTVAHHETASAQPFVYRDADLSIDTLHHEVIANGSLLELSPIEFRLLVALAEAPRRVHTYASLLQTVWGQEYSDEIDFLRVYVSRLRRKLEVDPEQPKRIVTERGFGYRFMPQR